jgi:hypothetical protein
MAKKHEALAALLRGVRGCHLDRVRVVVKDGSIADRRLHATRDIRAGEEVLSIGAAAVVTLERAAQTTTARELGLLAQSKAGGAGQEGTGGAIDGSGEGGGRGAGEEVCRRHLAALPNATLSHCLLAIFLLEATRGSGAAAAAAADGGSGSAGNKAAGEAALFAAYAATLPRPSHVEPQFPVCWATDQVERRLGGSTMDLAVLGAVDELLDSYRAICTLAPFFSRHFTFEQWRWARVMVSSRTFGIVTVLAVRGGGATATGSADVAQCDRVLVPVADMMNHGFERQTDWAWVPDDDEGGGGGGDAAAAAAGGGGAVAPALRWRFVVRALRSIREGEELTCCYGAKSNARWLLGYGMTLDVPRPAMRLAGRLAGEEGHGGGGGDGGAGCVAAAESVMAGGVDEVSVGDGRLGRFVALRPSAPAVGSEAHAGGCSACAAGGLDTVCFVMYVHDMFPLWERKLAQLNGRYRNGRKVALSALHADCGTREYFSWLRYLVAQQEELDLLPWRWAPAAAATDAADAAAPRAGALTMADRVHLGLDAILPLSLASEVRVMEAVLEMMECQQQQQQQHERRCEQAKVAAKGCETGSGELLEAAGFSASAARILQGERRVCQHYATFATAALALLRGAQALARRVTLPRGALARQDVRAYAAQLHEQRVLDLAFAPAATHDDCVVLKQRSEHEKVPLPLPNSKRRK